MGLSRWKDQDAYQQAFERLIRDLKAEDKMNQQTDENSNVKSNQRTNRFLALVIGLPVLLIATVIFCLSITSKLTASPPEPNDPNKKTCMQFDSPILSFSFGNACPTSTPVISRVTPSNPISTPLLCQPDPSPKDFISALCQEICYTDKIATTGKSAIIMLYQDKTDPTVLANEVGVLDFEIRSRPDEGEREKIPRQLIRASRYIDQQYDDISLTRIEVVVPADENIPESVFMATSPEWKIEEGILIHTLKPVAKFSCN